MLEAEGAELDREVARITPRDALGHQGAELVDVHVAGIDAQIRPRADRFQQGPLAGDRFAQRQVVERQRVAAPRFAEAVDQRLVGRFDEGELEGLRRALQGIEDIGQLLEVRLAVAGVDAYRHLTVVWQVAHVHEAREVGEKTRRQVVHAIEPGVFQRVQGGGFTRPRHA